MYDKTKVEFHGLVPVETKTKDKTEVTKLPFVLKDTISNSDRRAFPRRTVKGNEKIGRQEYDKLAKTSS